MRFVLVFLAIFTPMACAIWYLAGDVPASIALVPVARAGPAETVITSKDMPYSPVDGRITRFQKGRVQRFDADTNHVSYWVQVDGIGRADGRPRLEGIRCALFGKPRDGKPNLQLTVKAPYLEGDPIALLQARRGLARVLRLGGGVVVSDERGRTIAELESLVIDIGKEEVRSDGAVFFRSPKKNAQLRGSGLVADLRFHSATILREVRVLLPLPSAAGSGGAAARLSCSGHATLVRVPGTGELVVTLEDAARIDHESARGGCDRITAFLRETKKTDEAPASVELVRLMLEGKVEFELDPEVSYNLEHFAAASITILGQREIIMRGGTLPVRAVRRGPLEMFGLADRVLDIEAPEIRILLRPAGPDGKPPEKPLESITFPRGLTVNDRDGSGRLVAGRVRIDAHGGRMEADGGVEASMPGRRLSAERIDVRRIKKPSEVILLSVFGKKRFQVRPTGTLGPLTRAGVARLVFSSADTLYIESIGKRATMRTAGNVLVTGDAEQMFRCDSIEVAIDETAAGKSQVQSLDARGRVEGLDPRTKANLRADRLRYRMDEGSEIRLDGTPAKVSTPDGRMVEAESLRYREDGSFSANGSVDVTAIVASGKAAGTWRFRCDSAQGKIAADRTAEDMRADGNVRADGPEGKYLEADSVSYQKKSGVLRLRGKPARVRQGDEISYEGGGLDVKLGTPDKQRPARFELLRADTAGETYLVVRPKAPEKGGKNRIARWKIQLRGPASYDGKKVVIADGARIIGYDAADNLAVEGEAAEVTLEIERTANGYTPKALRGRKKVVVVAYKGGRRNATVRGRTLDYLMGSRLLELGGGCEVQREGDPKPLRFREVELEVMETGVDLKYLGTPMR